MAGPQSERRRSRLFSHFQIRSLLAERADRAGAQPRLRRLDHPDRAQDRGTERRVHGRGRTRHRTGQFREVLRLRRARRRRHDLDAASRRHAARSLSPFKRADGQEFQDRPVRAAEDLRARSLRRPHHEPRRRRRPSDLLARPAPLPDPDDGHHDARGGADGLARADRHPDLGCGRLRARHRGRADRDRAQAAGAAPRLPRAADAGEAAPRPRREQHDAGPAAVRRRAAAGDLQPALHRDVRPVSRGGEARLQLPRHHCPPQGDRLVQW
ncbi:hypothetical protein ABIF65_003038 [Bradyrhizobium japonicum]